MNTIDLTTIDLKIEQPESVLLDIRTFARQFFLDGGKLTFTEWSEMHPTVRSAFKQAQDDVMMDRLKSAAYLLRNTR